MRAYLRGALSSHPREVEENEMSEMLTAMVGPAFDAELAYRRDRFVAGRAFVEDLGLDPDDPDWRRIGHDWVRPRDPAARARLYWRRLRVTTAAG